MIWSSRQNWVTFYLFLAAISHCLTKNLQCSWILACQRDAKLRDIFSASSYLIRYEKSFLFMNSHIGESSCHLLNLFTIYSNKQCKTGLRFDDSKSFWEAPWSSQSLELSCSAQKNNVLVKKFSNRKWNKSPCMVFNNLLNRWRFKAARLQIKEHPNIFKKH